MIGVWHRLKRKRELRKKARQLDVAVYSKEFLVHRVAYIKDRIECINGIERRLGDIEYESYRRFGRSFGCPEVDKKREIEVPFEEKTQTKKHRAYELDWRLFFDEPLSSEEMLSPECRRESWEGFDAVFRNGVDTGIRIYTKMRFGTHGGFSSEWRSSQILLRISDCMIFHEPYRPDQWTVPKPKVSLEVQVGPRTLIAEAFYYSQNWTLMDPA